MAEATTTEPEVYDPARDGQCTYSTSRKQR